MCPGCPRCCAAARRTAAPPPRCGLALHSLRGDAQPSAAPVADYARHGKRSAGGLGSAFSGTWIGYALANIWCYALGVMVVSVAEPGTSLVTALLLAQGGLVALGLILIDELDNAYGDVYSGSVSTHSLLPRWSVKRWGLLLAALCIALALVLPMHTLEPFLLLLSSVFVPLYGVILGRLGGGRAVAPAGARPKVDLAAALIWIAGIAAYHALAKWRRSSARRCRRWR